MRTLAIAIESTRNVKGVAGSLRRLMSLAAVLSGVLLWVPATGYAATCERTAALLTVQLTSPSDTVFMRVSSGNSITVDGVTCTGAPTVNNIDAIAVSTAPGAGGDLLIVDAPKFAPGASGETGTPEIEIFVNLGPSGTGLQVRAPGGNVRVGGFGINTNAGPSEVEPDADVTVQGVGELSVSAAFGPSPSTFGAQGGLGTGGPLTEPVRLVGGSGFDTLTGGDAGDFLDGGSASDDLAGGGGADRLAPGPAGNDVLDGGAGTDTVFAGTGTSDAFGAIIDLALAGPQDTGGGGGIDTMANVENLVGTDGPDRLLGSAAANELRGSEGNDVLAGRGGLDNLFSEAGNDSIDARDGGPDIVACGPGTDTVIADAAGVDTLTDCESVAFPPRRGGAPPPAGEGANPGGGAAGALSFGPITGVTLELARRRIRPAGPVRVRVTNANGFPIAGRLAGQTLRRVVVSDKRRRLRLKGKSLRVPAHAVTTIKLRLTKRLGRLLKQKHKLALRMTAKVTDPGGQGRTVKKRLAPRLKR
jgi:RTX calcium-binding nonapeptide repeat (4 copies)